LLRTNVPDDQHAAQGVLSDLGGHELVGEIDIGSLLILDPFVEVAGGEDDIIEHPAALGDLGLEARLVQVRGASLDDILLMVLDAVEMSVGITRMHLKATHAQ